MSAALIDLLDKALPPDHRRRLDIGVRGASIGMLLSWLLLAKEALIALEVSLKHGQERASSPLTQESPLDGII